MSTQRLLNSDPDHAEDYLVLFGEENSLGIVHNIEIDSEDEELTEDEDIMWLEEQRLLNKKLHWAKRPSIFSIGVFLFTIAVSLLMFLEPATVILYKLACNTVSLRRGDGVCDPIEAQLLVADYNMATGIINPIILIIVLSKFGELSDKYGRRPFLILFVLFLFLSCLSILYIASQFETLHFVALVVAECSQSLGGGIASASSIAKAYVSDVTNPEDRIASLSMLMSFLTFGLSLSPILTTFIIKYSKSAHGLPDNQNGMIDPIKIATTPNTFQLIDRRDFLPLKVGTFVLFLSLLYAVFILPESRSEKAQLKSRSFSQAQLAPINDSLKNLQALQDRANFTWMTKASKYLNFLKPLKLLSYPKSIVKNDLGKQQIVKTRSLFLVIIILSSLSFTILIGVMAIVSQYGIYKFKWEASDITTFFFFLSSTKSLALLFLPGFLSTHIFRKRMGFKVFKTNFDMVDFSLIVFGYSMESIFYALVSLAPSNILFTTFYAISTLGAMTDPTLTSAAIKLIPESKIGEFFGGLSILQNLLNIISPLIVVNIYKFGLKLNYPGLVFLIPASVYGIGVLVFFIIKRVIHLDGLTEEQESLVRSKPGSRRVSTVQFETPSREGVDTPVKSASTTTVEPVD